MRKSTKIFVNLPVKDLEKSIKFFTTLGFSFDPHFTDENATCMIVGENNFVMLLVEPFFKTFIKNEISDSKNTTEVIISFSVDSREEVDEIVNNAFLAGGLPSNDKSDQGFMYMWSFQDLDGHLWEVGCMDESMFGSNQ